MCSYITRLRRESSLNDARQICRVTIFRVRVEKGRISDNVEKWNTKAVEIIDAERTRSVSLKIQGKTPKPENNSSNYVYIEGCSYLPKWKNKNLFESKRKPSRITCRI